MCLGILSSILESHEEDHLCILGDCNATLGSPRVNEICRTLHENNFFFVFFFKLVYFITDNEILKAHTIARS